LYKSTVQLKVRVFMDTCALRDKRVVGDVLCVFVRRFWVTLPSATCGGTIVVTVGWGAQ
jgi:hypothetical protein